ncbi:hypothetical protein WMY93_032776 [Mugilogobius chulae]|uniref:Uncharacterized protein n=1 Tax=Mugilogobius chulae TaxID=88201 RepID=A0AAW0MIU4_9GOBI
MRRPHVRSRVQKNVSPAAVAGTHTCCIHDPSEEARRIKDDPSVRDRSAPVKEETVRENARTVVRVRGGDVSDQTEVLGEYILQFGKSFRWLLENDVGYTLYLIQSHQKEEAAGVSLTAGSTTTTVPVVVMPPAAVNPSPPALTVTPPLSQETLEKIVQGIVEKQQQQQQQQQPPAPLKKPHTKKCLSCGQPKSKYEGDGSSIHEFYQQGPVRYFYCSTKVFNTYGAEGLTDPRMPFKDFVATEFFQRELEATKQRVEERQQQKRKREESPAPGRKCRFCKLELKQGPNSPHIHTSFPGLPGKYIYCPAKVFSMYREQGMEREMSWRQFQQSPFYEKEKERLYLICWRLSGPLAGLPLSSPVDLLFSGLMLSRPALLL